MMIMGRLQTCVGCITPLSFCIISSLIEISLLSSLDSAMFVRVPNFDGYLHKTYNLTGLKPVKSRTACASICMQNLECGSFFYVHKPEKLCQTHSVLFKTTNEAVATTSASYYQLTQSNCPYNSGYILYRPFSLCYKYFATNVTWTGAQKACGSIHSHLINIKTVNISDHLIRFMRASSNLRQVHVSVGANLVNGSWHWSDGSLATWTNWASGEPSSPAEQCLCIAWFYTFKWNDVPCTGNTSAVQRAYICQLDI